MPDQQYTFVHPVDHQTYHTDLRTAEHLHELRNHYRSPTAYAAFFEQARAEGRIVEGVAPSLEPTPSSAQGETAQRIVVHVDRDVDVERRRMAYVPINRVTSEPSAGE